MKNERHMLLFKKGTGKKTNAKYPKWKKHYISMLSLYIWNIIITRLIATRLE